MRIFYPILFSVIVITFFGLLQILFFRLFNKIWWQKKWVRYTCWGLPLLGIISINLWGLGEYNTIDYLTFPGAIMAVLVFIFEFCLILSLPFSGILNFINKLFDKYRPIENGKNIDINRRRLLKTTAASVPFLALSAGGAGVVRALGKVNVYRRPMTFDNLPDDLDGFRILHLSDIHLRHYVTLGDLENTLKDAEQFSPNMVLVTGDIADELNLLPDTLKMLTQLNTTYGSFACLGNHEYFRGVDIVRGIFDKSPIPLFINEGVSFRVKDSQLFIGGIDDPRRMGAKEHQFFKQTIDKTNLSRPKDAFSILMSHRPDALDYASETNVNLVLAGHTHGGQIGFGGRSLFESSFPDRYLWGEYRMKNTALYTSSGAGHWFPFRLGCPPEAPVIELIKS